MTEQKQNSDGDNGADSKDSTDRRVADAVGAVVVFAFLGLVAAAVFGFGGASLAAVPQAWFMLLGLIVLSGAVAALGEKSVKVASKLRGK